MNRIDEILTQVESLDKNALELVAHKLFQLLKGLYNCSHECSVHKCRKCGGEHIMKYGKDGSGKQRYRCKDCGATFFETSGSVISGTHCSNDKWGKYIELLIDGASLQRCAEECDISVQTAFLWRYKILHALQADQDNGILYRLIIINSRLYSYASKTETVYVSAIEYAEAHGKSWSSVKNMCAVGRLEGA